MRVADLVLGVTLVDKQGEMNTPVSGISLYAEKTTPGDVFMTVRGLYRDGHELIGEAIHRGAVAVIGERSPAELVALGWLPPDFPYVQAADGRGAPAQVAAAFYGYPGRRLTMIGVTGTDGKTTTSNLIYGVLRAAGRRVGAITTVSAKIGDQELDTGFHTTTPDAPDVQRFLAKMVEADMEVVVLETTSHGLAQKRVDAIDFDVAVVTNITHEHLDAHGGSLAAYQQAKATLFRKLSQAPSKPGLPKTAILNADDSSFEYLAPIPAERTLTYGSLASSATARDLDVYATQITTTASGLRFMAHTPTATFSIQSSLLGVYNVHNILAALAVGVAFDISVEAMQAGIASVTGVLGRMDPINEGQPFLAVVDFAHTPNALEQALRAGRAMLQPPTGRVIVVFGSAGLRDRAKRRMMGAVAGRLADSVIITAEDPRTEDLDGIMAESVAAATEQGKVEGVNLFRVADRGEAIFRATQMARSGDIVLVCGKGHEQSMCFGVIEYPWSDHAALRSALRGAPLQTLPTANP